MTYHWEEEKLGAAYDSALMRRLLTYVRPYKKLFAVCLGLIGIITVCELTLPYLTKIAIDQYIRPGRLGGLYLLAAIFVGILVIRLIASFAQVYLLQLSGQKIMRDMRTQIFDHLMKLPTKFFDRNPVGRLVTRATNDVAAINEMYASVLVYLFKDVFLVLGIFIIMLQLNWQLGLLILVLAPIIAYATWEFRKRARDAYRDFRRKLAKLNAYMQESLSGMRIIQLFAQEERSYKTFQSINQEEYEANMRQLMVFAIYQPIIHMMSAIAVALIIWYGGGGVMRGVFTLGSLVAFLNYVEMLFAPIRDLAEKYNILQGAMASAERIFMLLDEKPEDRGKGRVLPSVRGRIEFRDVWFAYEDEDWVLRGVSFTVEPGERVAIVGPTGSGKTTIISLLTRLYDIQKGQILLDGVDIRELDVQFLRSQMAVVLQDVFLFSGDVLGNITLQNEKISRERAIEAARFVQASSFIEQLPNGYDAEVKERGATLSVGQRQLLAFARAVAFDPKILILDEATANIDSQTESLIQESLQKILRGRTSITIAHRLSTIRESDKIIVLHKGVVVEQGTHEELLARKGLYYALYTLQFAEAEAVKAE
jgi:ATP-binding cassette subfamily B multidrug efflux pump